MSANYRMVAASKDVSINQALFNVHVRKASRKIKTTTKYVKVWKIHDNVMVV